MYVVHYQHSSGQQEWCLAISWFPSTSFSLTIPQSLSLTVKSPSVLLNSTLSMENFISQTAKSCYYPPHRISSVWKYLSTEATVKLVTSLVLLPRLDYCNSLLSGLPASSVHSLPRIQNCATHLILRKYKTDHITPVSVCPMAPCLTKNSVQDKHSLL